MFLYSPKIVYFCNNYHFSSKERLNHLNIKINHEEIFPFNLYSHDGFRLRRL